MPPKKKRKNNPKDLFGYSGMSLPKIRQFRIAKPRFNPFEDRVLRVMRVARRPLTTSQVAEFSGISFSAAKANLLRLMNKRLIKSVAFKNRIYWKF